MNSVIASILELLVLPIELSNAHAYLPHKYKEGLGAYGLGMIVHEDEPSFTNLHFKLVYAMTPGMCG